MGLFDDEKLNLEPAPARHLPELHYRSRQSKRLSIGQHDRFILSPIGKQKADNFTASGVKHNTMSYMAEEGSVSPAELENELQISLPKAKAILMSLLRSQYIKPSGDGGMA